MNFWRVGGGSVYFVGLRGLFRVPFEGGAPEVAYRFDGAYRAGSGGKAVAGANDESQLFFGSERLVAEPRP